MATCCIDWCLPPCLLGAKWWDMDCGLKCHAVTQAYLRSLGVGRVCDILHCLAGYTNHGLHNQLLVPIRVVRYVSKMNIVTRRGHWHTRQTGQMSVKGIFMQGEWWQCDMGRWFSVSLRYPTRMMEKESYQENGTCEMICSNTQPFRFFFVCMSNSICMTTIIIVGQLIIPISSYRCSIFLFFCFSFSLSFRHHHAGNITTRSILSNQRCGRVSARMPFSTIRQWHAMLQRSEKITTAMNNPDNFRFC